MLNQQKGAVSPDAIVRWQNPARRHHVVSELYGSWSVLANLVRFNHPQYPFARARACQNLIRATYGHLSVGRISVSSSADEAICATGIKFAEKYACQA